MFEYAPITKEYMNCVYPSFSAFAEHGVLVTAGHGTKNGEWNTMTAAWALAGYLWNRPCAALFIRPQRYTADFFEEEDYASISFFDCREEKNQQILHICGTVSGRTEDKAAKAGITPILHDDGVIGFEEAVCTVACRKLYRSQFDMDLFLDPQVIIDCYPKKDFHYVYFCELRDAYTRK
ncbi:MAG: flavin reductase [Treponema sp.]